MDSIQEVEHSVAGVYDIKLVGQTAYRQDRKGMRHSAELRPGDRVFISRDPNNKYGSSALYNIFTYFMLSSIIINNQF